MKGILLGLGMMLSLGANAAMHPASQFVNETMNQGKRILEQKSGSNRLSGLCSLLNQKVSTSYISSAWLGQYQNLAREANAVRQFRRMIPSLILTKAFAGNTGGSVSGSFSVGEQARDRGNGRYGVSITVNTGGRTYNGTIVVQKTKSGMRMIDGEYMGYSAVKYIGRDYRQILDAEYKKNPNASMPVTALINEVKSDSTYIACP